MSNSGAMDADSTKASSPAPKQAAQKRVDFEDPVVRLELKAFDTLSSILLAGNLRQDESNALKARLSSSFIIMNLLKKHESETHVLEQVFRDEIGKQREFLRNNGVIQNEDLTQKSTLEKKLSEAEHEYALSKEKGKVLKDDIETLDISKLQLKFSLDEFKRQNEQQLHPMLASIRQTNEDTQETNRILTEQIAKLKQEEVFALKKEETASLLIEEETKKTALINTELKTRKDEPENYKRQADSREIIVQQGKAKITELELVLKEHEVEEKELRKQLANLNDESNKTNDDTAKLRDEIARVEQQGVMMQAELDSERRRNVELSTARNTLTKEIQEIQFKQKSTQDKLNSATKELNTETMRYQKSKAEIDSAQKSIPEVETLKVSATKMLVNSQNGVNQMKKKLSENRSEIELLINELLSNEEFEEELKEKIKKVVNEIDELKVLLVFTKKKEVNLRKVFDENVSMRDLKLNEYRIGNLKTKELASEIYIRNGEIAEKEREIVALRKQSQLFTKMYERAGVEKNTYQSLEAQCRLLSREITAKTAIAEDEVVILKNEIEIAKKEGTILSYSLVKLSAQKDTLTAEMNKMWFATDTKLAQRQQLDREISSAERALKQNKAFLAEIELEYRRIINDRDNIAHGLLNENEEIKHSVSYANTLQANWMKENAQFQERIEELRKLNIVYENQLHELGQAKLANSNVPKKLQEQIRVFTKELEEIRGVNTEFEKKLVSPENEGRKFIEVGSDDVLGKKEIILERMEKVQAALKQKEEIIKATIIAKEEFDKKAAKDRAISSQFLPRINTLRNKLDDISSKLLSGMAELSLHKSNVVQAQKSMEEMNQLVESAKQNLESGKAPTIEAEREWYNIELKRKTKLNELIAANLTNLTENDFGSLTYAKRRSNAYIPDDGIGLPKMYGRHAPFQPSEQGAIMRHFRKPNVPLVE